MCTNCRCLWFWGFEFFRRSCLAWFFYFWWRFSFRLTGSCRSCNCSSFWKLKLFLRSRITCCRWIWGSLCFFSDAAHFKGDNFCALLPVTVFFFMPVADFVAEVPDEAEANSLKDQEAPLSLVFTKIRKNLTICNIYLKRSFCNIHFLIDCTILLNCL